MDDRTVGMGKDCLSGFHLIRTQASETGRSGCPRFSCAKVELELLYAVVRDAYPAVRGCLVSQERRLKYLFDPTF